MTSCFRINSFRVSFTSREWQQCSAYTQRHWIWRLAKSIMPHSQQYNYVQNIFYSGHFCSNWVVMYSCITFAFEEEIHSLCIIIIESATYNIFYTSIIMVNSNMIYILIHGISSEETELPGTRAQLPNRQ